MVFYIVYIYMYIIGPSFTTSLVADGSMVFQCPCSGLCVCAWAPDLTPAVPLPIRAPSQRFFDCHVSNRFVTAPFSELGSTFFGIRSSKKPSIPNRFCNAMRKLGTVLQVICRPRFLRSDQRGVV